MKKVFALSITISMLAATPAFANEVKSSFNESTGVLELTDLVFGGSRYYIRLVLTDPNNLTFQADLSSAVDITPAPEHVNATADDIVGTWNVDGEDGTSITFNSDGTYSQNQAAGIDEEECPEGGIESGTYAWTPDTGLISISVSEDNNGQCGFSHPQGTLRMLVDGNVLSLLEGSTVGATLSR